MIGHLSGHLKFFMGREIIVQPFGSGVGYRVEVSDRDRVNMVLDAEVSIYTSHVQREDSSKLYGFRDMMDLLVFENLVKLPKFGPAAAMKLLSSVAGHDVRTGNFDPRTVKGIGPKTAEIVMNAANARKL